MRKKFQNPDILRELRNPAQQQQVAIVVSDKIWRSGSELVPAIIQNFSSCHKTFLFCNQKFEKNLLLI